MSSAPADPSDRASRLRPALRVFVAAVVAFDLAWATLLFFPSWFRELRFVPGWEWIQDQPQPLFVAFALLQVAAIFAAFGDLRSRPRRGFPAVFTATHVFLVLGISFLAFLASVAMGRLLPDVFRLDEPGVYERVALLASGESSLDATLWAVPRGGGEWQAVSEAHYPPCRWPFEIRKSPAGPRYLFVDVNGAACATLDLGTADPERHWRTFESLSPLAALRTEYGADLAWVARDGDPTPAADPVDLRRVVASAAAAPGARPAVRDALKRTAKELRRRGVVVTAGELRDFGERHRQITRLVVDREERARSEARARLRLELLRDRYERPDEFPAILARAMEDHGWLDEATLERQVATVPDADAAERYLAALPDPDAAVALAVGGEARRTLLALGARLGRDLLESGDAAAEAEEEIGPRALYLGLVRPGRVRIRIRVFRDGATRDAAFDRLRAAPGDPLEGASGLLEDRTSELAPWSLAGRSPPWLVELVALGMDSPQPVAEAGGDPAAGRLGRPRTRGPAIAEVLRIDSRPDVGSFGEWEETLRRLPAAERELRAFARWLDAARTAAGATEAPPSLTLP